MGQRPLGQGSNGLRYIQSPQQAVGDVVVGIDVTPAECASAKLLSDACAFCAALAEAGDFWGQFHIFHRCE